MRIKFIYSSPLIYQLVLRGLYGRYYNARFESVAALIPAGATVLDICCGPGVLYHRHLRRKGVKYQGIDANPRFIARVIRDGGQGKVCQVGYDNALPSTDYVVMQGSLYQFLPDAVPIVDRMLRASRRRVIIAEPIRNLASSRVGWVAALARTCSDHERSGRVSRFTERSLDELFAPYGPRVVESFLIPGGRDKVYVLDAAG